MKKRSRTGPTGKKRWFMGWGAIALFYIPLRRTTSIVLSIRSVHEWLDCSILHDIRKKKKSVFGRPRLSSAESVSLALLF